jgi:hypothetical protein
MTLILKVFLDIAWFLPRLMNPAQTVAAVCAWWVQV